MEEYEQKTGKLAIWQGKVTKGFLKWKEGESYQYSYKKRISVYISNDTEKKWREFMHIHNFSSFSKLIRFGVDYFINEKSKFGGKLLTSLENGQPDNIAHMLKEKLTTICGFSQLLLEKYSKELNEDIQSIINNILNETKQLEYNLSPKLEMNKLNSSSFDILLIEDHVPTTELLKKYFENKGYSFKGVLTGLEGIEELNRNFPKLILLDIILPDISGYDICKEIKSNKRLKNIPVFYLTAVTRDRVEEKLNETMADGFILKPFDLPALEFLFEFISSSPNKQIIN
jgi:CheY-like chemotaxis protein